MSTGTQSGTVAQDLIEAFDRDGFVVVPDLLTADELATFEPAVSAGVARRTAHDTRPLAELSRYEQSFRQCMNLWEEDPGVAPLTFHQGIAGAAAALLGVPALRIWHDQALYKEAGGRETDPHQDQPYWPIAETNTITAWVPFAGSTIDGGAMAYVAGSHKVGLRKFVNIFFGEPYDLLSDPALDGVEPTFVEVPAGSVAFHHGLTAHLAGANRTDQVRRVHTMIYFADGSTRGFPTPHPSVDRDGIEVGQVIDGSVTPIAWPRPDGTLPPLPVDRGESDPAGGADTVAYVRSAIDDQRRP